MTTRELTSGSVRFERADPVVLSSGQVRERTAKRTAVAARRSTFQRALPVVLDSCSRSKERCMQPRDLRALKVEEFEAVHQGDPVPVTYDCVREP
jgi:hypothetical protein